MNVIDLRDEHYNRHIEIIEMSDDCVYYAEKLSVNNEERICIYSYDFSADREKKLSFFSLADDNYTIHFYACRESILIFFENNSGTVWLIKVDKDNGETLLKKSLSLIGRYYSCLPVDDNYIIIYTRESEDTKPLFETCRKVTGSSTIANLYDLRKDKRYFVKDYKTAKLMRDGADKFRAADGKQRFIVCDPGTVSDKETLVKKIDSAALRDNIWLVSKRRLVESIKNGDEKIKLNKVASAGAEGTVQYVCISGDSVVFRAKVFKTQAEQFVGMSVLDGSFKTLGNVHKKENGSFYFVDKQNGKVYFEKRNGAESYKVTGEIGSEARLDYPSKLGFMVGCVDDRYIIAHTPGVTAPTTAIYDSRLKTTDTFGAKAVVKGETVVLY